MIVGGFTDPQPATQKIQEIADQVKPQLEGKENKKYPVFVATEYISQVVAGTNYIIKVTVMDFTQNPMVVCKKWKVQRLNGKDDLEYEDCGLNSAQVCVSNSNDEYVHLKVFQSLPHDNKGPTLTSYQTDKTKDDPLDFF